MKIRIAIFFIYAALLGCSKDNSQSIVLNAPLTDCPANVTCNYNYYEGADFTSSNQLVHGRYIVFAYNSFFEHSPCGTNTLLYFKIFSRNNYFNISSSQIAKGQATGYIDSCPCCEYFAPVVYPKPIGGEIKGKRIDSHHWLINATVIFGTTNGAPIDTITVNQYFTLAKLP